MDIIDACGEGNVDKVKKLLESGSDPASKTHTGRTALMMASTRGNIEIV